MAKRISAELRETMLGLQYIAKTAKTEHERDAALAVLVKLQHASGETLGESQFGK